jgi:chemotaxis protein MotB
MDRKPQYLQTGTTQRDRWMISYSDIMTILLILFISIAAQAFQQRLHAVPVTEDASAEKPKPVLLQAPPVETPPEYGNLRDAQKALQERGIDPKLEPRGLVISLPQAILFPSGQDEISDAARPLIWKIADVLAAMPNKVTLVGHADAVPIHTSRFKNNFELSAARSLKLLEILSSHYGIPESRLSAASYGSYSPKAPNDTEDGRAENRRVEIVILPESAP